jgi:hypothetical protein
VTALIVALCAICVVWLRGAFLVTHVVLMKIIVFFYLC